VKAIVIGAGAWGLPTAAQLAGRGHAVTLVDRFGVQNARSSSIGPTRLWRLADPDPARVRLSVRGVDAMERLQSRCGTTVFAQRGLLWRDDRSLPALTETLGACGIEYTAVSPADVGRWWPGLRPDGRDAVWQPAAGIVLAAASLQAQLRLFETAGGTAVFGRAVADVSTTAAGVRVSLHDGEVLAADVVVVAAGPGATTLNPLLGVEVPLHPYLEQVVHFGDAARPHHYDDLPGLFDGPTDAQPGIYAMPTPGVGYKVGLDNPLRDYREDDDDRTPDPQRTELIRRRVAADLGSVPPTVLDAQVCSWTDSPDGKFVIDVLDGGVVVACGDSGEGFKFSALMGEVLADLAEGATPDDDIAALSAARFADGLPARSGPHVLGRH
jgi:glycine/D-amino acid oxidase-like deaminating enzyme